MKDPNHNTFETQNNMSPKIQRKVVRLPRTEMMVTRRKLAQQKRQLREMDRSMRTLTQLLKSPTRMKKPKATRSPKKCDISPKLKKPHQISQTDNERPKYKTCKPSTAQSGLKSKQPTNPELTVEQMIRVMEDAGSMDEEDLMEILTCPSPVWWEDPPDPGYTEKPIYRRIATNNITKSKRIERRPRKVNSSKILKIEEEEEIGINKADLNTNISKYSTDMKFMKKRGKLENILGNIKNKNKPVINNSNNNKINNNRLEINDLDDNFKINDNEMSNNGDINDKFSRKDKNDISCNDVEMGDNEKDLGNDVNNDISHDVEIINNEKYLINDKSYNDIEMINNEKYLISDINVSSNDIEMSISDKNSDESDWSINDEMLKDLENIDIPIENEQTVKTNEPKPTKNDKPLKNIEIELDKSQTDRNTINMGTNELKKLKDNTIIEKEQIDIDGKPGPSNENKIRFDSVQSGRVNTKNINGEQQKYKDRKPSNENKLNKDNFDRQTCIISGHKVNNTKDREVQKERDGKPGHSNGSKLNKEVTFGRQSAMKTGERVIDSKDIKNTNRSKFENATKLIWNNSSRSGHNVNNTINIDREEQTDRDKNPGSENLEDKSNKIAKRNEKETTIVTDKNKFERNKNVNKLKSIFGKIDMQESDKIKQNVNKTLKNNEINKQPEPDSERTKGLNKKLTQSKQINDLINAKQNNDIVICKTLKNTEGHKQIDTEESLQVTDSNDIKLTKKINDLKYDNSNHGLVTSDVKLTQSKTQINDLKNTITVHANDLNEKLTQSSQINDLKNTKTVHANGLNEKITQSKQINDLKNTKTVHANDLNEKITQSKQINDTNFEQDLNEMKVKMQTNDINNTIKQYDIVVPKNMPPLQKCPKIQSTNVNFENNDLTETSKLILDKIKMFFQKDRVNKKKEYITVYKIVEEEDKRKKEKDDKKSLLVPNSENVKYCFKCSSIFETDICMYCSKTDDLECVCDESNDN